jgi:hypothetical protein
MMHEAYLVCFLLLFVATSAHGRRVSQYAPSHYFVIGDRFSGVNYLSNLLNEAKGLQLKQCLTHADPKWKHSFFSLRELELNLDCDLDRTIVIMVTKDPFAWLSSVAKRKFGDVTPHHLLALVSNRFEDTLELNIGSSKISTTSIIKLRTRKLKAHHYIIKRMKNGVLIRYEDLLQDADRAVKNALRGNGLAVGSFNMSSTLIATDLGKRDSYLNKDYLQIFPQKAIDRSIQKLDTKLETKLLGYKIPPLDDWVSPKELKIRDRNWYQRCWYTCVEVLWWIVIPTIALIMLSMLIILCRDIKQVTSSFFFNASYGKNAQTTIQSNEKWFQLKESTTGQTYYRNRITGRVQWNRPRKFIPYHRDEKLD